MLATPAYCHLSITPTAPIVTLDPMFEDPSDEPHRKQAPVEADWELKAEDWLKVFAEFLKLSFTYPANNVRVATSRTSFMQGFELTGARFGTKVAIVLDGNNFLVEGKEIKADSAYTEWLRAVFLKTSIGGVEFEPTLTEFALQDFAEQLRVNFSSGGGSFEDLWGSVIAGLKPIELRLTGRFGNLDSQAEAVAKGGERLDVRDQVAELLSHDERIAAKLKHLQEMLDERVSDNETAIKIDILEPISKALPAEALNDPELACQLVDEILDACGKRVLAMVADENGVQPEILDAVVASVGQRFFRTRAENKPSKWNVGAPECRPGDAKIGDDLEMMLEEYRALPAEGDIRFDIGKLRIAKETVSVHIHQLLRHESELAVERSFENLRELVKENPRLSRCLVPYVDLCLTDADLTDRRPVLWRIIDFVRTAELSRLLGGRDYLSADVAVRAFPRSFVPFLDSRLMHSKKHAQEVVDVCERIGPERVARGAEFLLKVENLITERRVDKLIATSSKAVLPLLKIIVENGPDWVRKPIAKFLQQTSPPMVRSREGAAFNGVHTANKLSPKYLGALCDPDPDDDVRKWMVQESARLLRAFLLRTQSGDDTCEQRIAAIKLLRRFPSMETLAALRAVKEEGGILIFGKQRALRKIASEAHHQMIARIDTGIKT